MACQCETDNTTNNTTTNIFALFNTDNTNLAYISIKQPANNITLGTSTTDLSKVKDVTIQPTANPSTTSDTGIIINPEPRLSINKYTTLQLRYHIVGSASGIKIRLVNGSDSNKGDNIIFFKNIEGTVVDTLFTLTLGDITTTNLRFFSEEILNFNVQLFFTDTTSTNGIVIKQFDLHTLEGDQMTYDSEEVRTTFNAKELLFHDDVVSRAADGGLVTEGAAVAFSSSGIQPKLYLEIPTTLLTATSGLTLQKEFTLIDYPDYLDGAEGEGTYGLTDALADLGNDLGDHNNPNIPIGYNYLLQFIFNDITFTNVPSLELSGIYGNFNSPTYYNEDNVWITISMSGDEHHFFSDIEDEYDKGYRMKLKVPSLSISGIYNSTGTNMVDYRNSKHYVLKKITIIFAKFHNALFDFFYNHKDISGNALSTDNPFIKHSKAPTIDLNPIDGSNAQRIFEFIRRHTILHYQAMIIQDILPRYCDSDDVSSYLKENSCSINSSSNIVGVSGTNLSVEFVELLRLLTQFDQNEVNLSNTHNLIRKYKLYESAPNNFSTFDKIGTTVSGIRWGNVFKSMEQIPYYSKPLLPLINVSTISGDSLQTDPSEYSPLTVSGIIEFNPYFYFANARMYINNIASGQQIRSLLKDANGESLCPIDTYLFTANDTDSILKNHNAQEFTQYIYYILYEAAIFTRGSKLAKNGVASNILLRNIMQCLYNSVINYTNEYLTSTPQIFDVYNGGVDISGNIRVGELNDDFTINTTDTFYMRDIISAASSIDPSGIQHYYILPINGIYSTNTNKYVTTINSTNDRIYVSKQDYTKLEGLKDKLYTTNDGNTYTFINTSTTTYSDVIEYEIQLLHAGAFVGLPNSKLSFVFYSNIET